MSTPDDSPSKRFVDEPVPPSRTTLWRDWQNRCRALSAAEAVPQFIATLKEGSESQQYAALLGLRMFGFSAFAEDYGPNFVYRIRAPGTSVEEVIKPKHLPEAYQP
jgi:hypothetical protein